MNRGGPFNLHALRQNLDLNGSKNSVQTRGDLLSIKFLHAVDASVARGGDTLPQFIACAFKKGVIVSSSELVAKTSIALLRPMKFHPVDLQGEQFLRIRKIADWPVAFLAGQVLIDAHCDECSIEVRGGIEGAWYLYGYNAHAARSRKLHWYLAEIAQRIILAEFSAVQLVGARKH